MTQSPTTLAELAQTLVQSPAPADLPLRVETPAGPMGAGLHVTEIKHAEIRSLDCGRSNHRWDEITVQFLDQPAGRGLTSAKLAGILQAAAFELGERGQQALTFEGAPGNTGLHRMRLDRIETGPDAVTLHLAALTPTCKPAATFVKSEGLATCC